MKLMLVAPIHHYFELFSQNSKTLLKGQGQKSWVDAFEELGIQYKLFIYTDPVILPKKTIILREKFEKYLGLVNEKIKKAENKYFYFIPWNYLKNLKLIIRCVIFKPDIIILSGGFTFLFSQTIFFIKSRYPAKILLFSGTNPVVSATISEKKLITEGLIDYVVENDKSYARLWTKIGAKKTIVLPISSVDPEIHKKIKLTKHEELEFASDVCFVGSITKDRIRYLLELREFNFKFWGDIKPGVKIPDLLKANYKGQARGETMVKIFNASKICINLQPHDMQDGGNMRTFEIPGSGAFQLADRVADEYFIKGKEVVTFHSIIDLKKKVRYYLTHEQERKKIAEAGYVRAHRDHTYYERMKRLFDVV